MQIPILIDTSVLANLPKISPFFVCPKDFDDHFFQMFILLGMYNFGPSTNCQLANDDPLKHIGSTSYKNSSLAQLIKSILGHIAKDHFRYDI